MTLTNEDDAPSARVASAPHWHPRSDLDLIEQQLRAVERFNTARRMRQQAATATALSREMRVESSRTMEILRRQHQALIARAHEQLQVSGGPLQTTADRRVVLAHRNAWFLDKLSAALKAGGLRVVARVCNGADAVGLAIAEQPDLIFIEDSLEMVPGEAAIREIRKFAPNSLVTAQVGYHERVDQLLDAGATKVFTRQVPPGDVATALLKLVSA